MEYRKTISLLALVSIAAVSTATSQIMTSELGRLDKFDNYSQPFNWQELNSSADDYAPSYDPLTDNIYFCSERKGMATLYKHGPSTSSGSAVEIAPGTFNQNGEHRAFVSFMTSGEGVGAVFVQHDDQPRPTLVTILRDNGQINAGMPIESITSPSFTSHPAVSADGVRLVFSTDRAGNGKGLDLWVSERRNDRSWSTPTPLSTIINSNGDEITPAFIGNDSLLYASNGYGGKGGYDIFLTVLRGGIWQEPEPLEWINSEFDDSDCTMLPDGSIVFASNRPGGLGGLDLYISKP